MARNVYLRGRIWWIRYYRGGRKIFESSHSEKEADAKKLLILRQADKIKGILPQTGKLRFSVLIDDLMNDYLINGRKSAKSVAYKVINHVLPYFGDMDVSFITTPVIMQYKIYRKDEGAANATINRELAAVRRAFNLGVENGRITLMPKITLLKEPPPRDEIYEDDEVAKLIEHLPAYVRPIILFAYWTGWRKSEIMRLQLSDVDLISDEVRIRIGASKNEQVRIFAMTKEMRQLIVDQIVKIKASGNQDCQWVFHRNGQQIKDFRGAWEKALKESGIKAKYFHSFRRTALRRFDISGISERVAMALMGHKTRKMFDNYRVVSRSDLKDAAKKLSRKKRAK